MHNMQAQSPETHSRRSVFWVSNVHCSSCVAYITEILSEISTVTNIDVSILTHEVRVSHSASAHPADLVIALIHGAFEVYHATTFDERGSIISELDTTSWNHRSSNVFSTPRTSYSSISSNIKERLQSSKEKRHLANCEACQKEEAQGISQKPTYDQSLPEKYTKDITEEKEFQSPATSRPPNAASTPSSVKSSDTRAEHNVFSPQSLPQATEAAQSTSVADEYNARISIGGMSCASCANGITAAVESLDFIKEINVNLLTNSATVVYTGPRENIDLVTEKIEDIGFDAFLDETNQITQAPAPVQIQTSTKFVTEIAITGMTCGSCVGAVTRGIEELSFVRNVSVNLLSHSGRVEFDGRENLDNILEKIEDLGYDAVVNSVHPLNDTDNERSPPQSRVVSIRVDGMFCHHCPEKVLFAVESLPGVTVEGTPCEANPVIKVTYSPQPSFTIRSIISAIEEANGAFTASIYHPPSIEDRSRAMQLHERRRLLTRLLFVFAAAIPTFLIGIVFMSLVSSENTVRRYLEQTIWAGSVTRIEWALFIICTPVMFYGTDVFHTRALKEIHALWRPGSRVPIMRRFYRFGSMNLLISAGTSVAYFSSLAVLIVDAVLGNKTSAHSTTYFDSVVFLTLFILCGRFMEAYSKAKTGDAVSSLGKLRPSEALLVETETTGTAEAPNGPSSNQMKRIDVDFLEVGDTVRIPHGASPPADGVVVGDATYQFDESSLTGESRPVKKNSGDEVYTGSVNVGQPVHIRITELGSSSMLDRIIAIVREGQSKRAPLERVADMLTSHFVPVITLVAILTFLIWLALGHSGVLPQDYLDIARGGWTFWSLEFAIAVFVVACPCGLALAAPTALFVGGGLAAKHGILVKGGGEAFQEASRLDAIVFDKTGTLTEGGSLKVSDHEVLTKDADFVAIGWALAQKMEESSNHPIAQAISSFCETRSKANVEYSDIQEISGQGMRGTFSVTLDGSVHAQKYEAAIGNERLLHSILPSDNDTYFVSSLLSKFQSAGKSTAILSLRPIDTQSSEKSSFVPVIVFATSDTIRPEAISVISQLNDRHVEVFMCTGDNQTTAHAVADVLGIPRSNVMANVLPAEKADFIRQVQEGSVNASPLGANVETSKNSKKTRPIVAFVGDGVNDSPALAAADVSIAMASGSDVAINSASFILLNSDLSTILQLVLLSRRVFNRVRMNFGWAVVYNLCLVPVAAGVFYPIVSGHHEKMIGHETVTVNEHWRLSPVWAALAMALSSISVVTSSLALRIDRQAIRKLFSWT